MDITYNDKVTVDGSSYIYSEGGEIVLNLGSITFKDLFNLEFDLQTNTTSSWNAPLEIEGISGFNIQNAGYSSYFTCIWGNTSHVMDTYPITSDEYVHYHIWQQNGSIFIQITQSNGVSYSYNATYNGSFSTIHLGNYHKENRATGVVKNVKFTTVNNYLDTIGLTSLWSKIKSLFATKTELGSKANDSDVVHKSGDETITGTKTFSSNIVGNLTGNADTATKATQDSAGNQINTTYSKNGHTHDDRYYTESEIDNKLRGKSDTSHTHSYLPLSGGTLTGRLTSNDEIYFKDLNHNWSDTSLDTWTGCGCIVWEDTTGRRMHDLIGATNGVWRKSCFINENHYFTVNSNRDMSFEGASLKWNGTQVATINGVYQNLVSGSVRTFDNKNTIIFDWGSQVSGFVGIKVDTVIIGGIVTNNNLPTLLGEIGVYDIGSTIHACTGMQVEYGATVAGSALKYAAMDAAGGGIYDLNHQLTTIGTWLKVSGNSSNTGGFGLYRRIA